MEKIKRKRIFRSLLDNRILKKVVAAVGAIYVPWKGYATIRTNIVESKESIDALNEVGYSDIGINYNHKVHTNNFVILHVENKKNNDITALREKLEKCNELDISVGIVLDTEADNLSKMYQDVDFLQAIIKDYKIDLPVYCNIDGIMTNVNLNNAERTALIGAFIDKANRSDMYLGLYGTDTNLCDCLNYDICDTSLYDCYLVEDRDNLEYEGMTTIREDREGSIRASQDLSKLINGRNLNSSTKLVLTAKYEVKEDDTIHSLGLRFGLSDTDLMSYNNIKKEIKPGDIIYIPNLYKTVNQETNEVSYSYAIARGIDISDYQTKFDWDRIAETSDYVIVEVARDKANYQEHTGTYLEGAVEQVEHVVNHGLELGLYFCISKDMKVSVYAERLDEYLTKFDHDLESRQISLDKMNVPVFLDFELYYEHNNYYKLMEIFEKICREHGFCNIGIYGNKSTLDAINSNMLKDENINLKDTNWYVWKSGGRQYSARENTSLDDITLEDIVEVKNESYVGYTPVMMQVTNVCTDTGACNAMNHCDVSYLYEYEIFGRKFEEKMTGGIDELGEPMELVGNLEVDLDKYRNVPINKMCQLVDSAVSGFYVVLAACIVGKKLVIKLAKKQQGKTLSKRP